MFPFFAFSKAAPSQVLQVALPPLRRQAGTSPRAWEEFLLTPCGLRLSHIENGEKQKAAPSQVLQQQEHYIRY